MHDGLPTVVKQINPYVTLRFVTVLIILFLCECPLLLAQRYYPTSYAFTSQAGTTDNVGDGTGSEARFKYPSGAAVDSSGNLYVADTYNDTIRKITPGGVVSILAGSAGQQGSSDGKGSDARFYLPDGVAVDGKGNVYVADCGNDTIRKITPGGMVTTLAGSAGQGGSSDGTGSAARFNAPSDVAVDGKGNLYVTDIYDRTIRKITPGGVVTTSFDSKHLHNMRASGGVVTTLAGSAGQGGSSDGTGSTARFSYPSGAALDGSGNLYVADTYNDTIRKITPGGVVTTFAGSAGQGDSSDGTGSNARFFLPSGVAVDGSGNVYVADTYNDTIRKITPGGVVTTLAGSAGQAGNSDGTGSDARFYLPHGVTVDSSDNLYVTDVYDYSIRKITPGGVVTTLVGSAGLLGPGFGVAVDGSGNVYVEDNFSNTARNNDFNIRKITPGGVMTILACSGGQTGSSDGTGRAAPTHTPFRVAVDRSGNVYVADWVNYTVRKITPGGLVTTFAGSAGQRGRCDGTRSDARFYFPDNVAVDDSGNVYVVDSGIHDRTIRKITPGGVVSALAGSEGHIGNGLEWTVDGIGNVYVAGNVDNTIRKITPGGLVTTFAGSAGQRGSSDGTGSDARFNNPNGVAADGRGNIYVADSDNNTIRKITPGGMVTTLAGSAGQEGSNDGTGSDARFYHPYGLTVDGSGNVYVADTYNYTIRKITPGGVVTTLAGIAQHSGHFRRFPNIYNQ
jgi:sugar lactone lactonase YvrE